MYIQNTLPKMSFDFLKMFKKGTEPKNVAKFDLK